MKVKQLTALLSKLNQEAEIRIYIDDVSYSIDEEETFQTLEMESSKIFTEEGEYIDSYTTTSYGIRTT